MPVGTKTPKGDIAKVREMREQGMRVADIAREIGVCVNTVSRYVSKGEVGRPAQPNKEIGATVNDPRNSPQHANRNTSPSSNHRNDDPRRATLTNRTPKRLAEVPR